MAVFWLHFNRFGATRGDAETWTVRQGGRERHARKVRCLVPVETVYKGDTARQPRAYLRGEGRVTKRDGTITIRG